MRKYLRVFFVLISVFIYGCDGGGGSSSGNNSGGTSQVILKSISVSPANPSIANGSTQQFTATGTYSDNSTQDLTSQVAWSSSDTGVATVNNGLATSVAAGLTTITAAYGGAYGSTTLGITLNLTSTVTTLAGTAGTTGFVDGTGTAALFNDPYGITTDGTNLYVADTLNSTIRKIVISTGAVTTFAGTAGSVGFTDGTGTAALFNRPYAITTDGTDLYVADTGNYIIRKIVISTGAVTTLAGAAGSIGLADGTGAAAQFNYPEGITTGGTDLYVADTGNSTIRKIVISTGTVATLAGTALSTGSADGTGPAAQFKAPVGVATDGTNLYVVDSGNSTIRNIVISTGAVTTLAGTAGSVGLADGTGAAARFYYPEGITTDGAALYVTDTVNSTVRKIR